ncbi:MAG: hypothetical protein V1799_18825 [bacterium]
MIESSVSLLKKGMDMVDEQDIPDSTLTFFDHRGITGNAKRGGMSGEENEYKQNSYRR